MMKTTLGRGVSAALVESVCSARTNRATRRHTHLIRFDVGISGQKVVTDLRWTTDFDADKAAGLRGCVLFRSTIEPAQVHSGIRRSHVEHDLAAGLQPIFKRKSAGAVGVIRKQTAAPH